MVVGRDVFDGSEIESFEEEEEEKARKTNQFLQAPCSSLVSQPDLRSSLLSLALVQ